MAKVKITMTLDREVIDRIKGFAVENGIPFSGAVSVLCNQALNAQRVAEQNIETMELYKQMTKLFGATLVTESAGDSKI